MNVPSDSPAVRWPHRRPVLAAVLVLVAAALVTALVLTTGGGADDASAGAGSPSSTSSSATSSAATSSAASTSTAPASASVAPAADTPEPTGPTADADEPPASLSPVALDQSAAVGDGVSAEVVSLESVDATAVGPGNVSGPALRVTVRLSNGTADPVSLGGVAVDLASGPDLIPASPVDDPSAAPFSGTVGAGGTAEGVYVFSLAEADRADVTLSVGYEAGAPLLVFTGAAS